MAEYLPLYENAGALTVAATGTIVGGTLVTVAGATAAAGSTTVLGVAGYDAVAGDNVTVFVRGVHRVAAAANIAAGALVKAAANGTVAPYVVGTDGVDQIVGRALKAATSGNLATFLV